MLSLHVLFMFVLLVLIDIQYVSIVFCSICLCTLSNQLWLVLSVSVHLICVRFAHA